MHFRFPLVMCPVSFRRVIRKSLISHALRALNTSSGSLWFHTELTRRAVAPVWQVFFCLYKFWPICSLGWPQLKGDRFKFPDPQMIWRVFWSFGWPILLGRTGIEEPIDHLKGLMVEDLRKGQWIQDKFLGQGWSLI